MRGRVLMTPNRWITSCTAAWPQLRLAQVLFCSLFPREAKALELARPSSTFSSSLEGSSSAIRNAPSSRQNRVIAQLFLIPCGQRSSGAAAQLT